jgi:hypothetical protein
MSVGNSQDVINAVIDFRVDIGLIEGPCHNVDIAEPWLEDELVVFASPASSLLQGEVTLERLAQAQWILREQAPARVKLSITCCCLICRISSWGWSWGTEAIRGASWPGYQLSFPARDCRTAGDGSLVEIPFHCRNWCARCGASIIVRNTFPARCSVFCAIARCEIALILASPQKEGKLCFTYNPGRVMKLSYN